MNRPGAPCKNCNNRKIACHANCELYNEFAIKLNEYNSKINNAKFIESITINEISRLKIEKAIQRKNKK